MVGAVLLSLTTAALHALPHLECSPSSAVYCLPDGYEVVERSLDDIRYVLNPTFSAEEVARLDQVQLLGQS